MSNLLATALFRNRRRSLAGRLADGLVALNPPSVTLRTGSYVRLADAALTTIAVFFVVNGGVATSNPVITTGAQQSIGGGAIVSLVDGGTRPKILLSVVQPIPSP